MGVSKRLLLPKAPIKKRDIVVRDYDDFCIQISGTRNATNQKFRGLQDTSTYTKARRHKDEKRIRRIEDS